MKRNALLLWAALYAVAFEVIYRLYLFPEFGRQKFTLYPHGLASHGLGLLIAVAPVFFYRGLRKISSYLSILIYVVCYVPMIVTLLLGLKRSLAEIVLLQLAFMGGMSLFFMADRADVKWLPDKPRRRYSIAFLHVFTLLATAVVALTYLGNMKIVSFENVYEHRFANAAIPMPFFVQYLVMWLASCLYPIYFAIGVARKKIGYAIAAVCGHVLIYMCTAAKLSLFTPVFILGAYIIARFGRRRILAGLLAAVIGVSAALLFVVPANNVVGGWAKSLLFNRTLGTSGWASYMYYDYFQKHGYTYYSHVNVVNAMTKGYPYGSLSLGQVIGKEYFSDVAANFNANFWVTDGIAAAGIPGIVAISVAVFLFMTFANSVFKAVHLSFGVLCVTAFALNLLNIPFFTSLLSGGGLPLLLIVRYVRLEYWKPVGDHSLGVA
jgi:hypothetical protein